MVFKLNILHLLAALGAACCAGVVVREAQGRDSLWTAAAIAALAVLTAVLTLSDGETGAYKALAATTAAAGYLGGRALALYLRTAHAPHRGLGLGRRLVRS